MFGLGTWEIILILGVGLIVLGPDKLPAVARKLGRSVRDLRRAATDFTREINLEGLDKPETWIAPEGQQAHGEELDEETPGEMEMDPCPEESEEHESVEAEEHESVEAEEHDPVEATDENEAETDDAPTSSGPYADLYDPRTQRSAPKDGSDDDRPAPEPDEPDTPTA